MLWWVFPPEAIFVFCINSGNLLLCVFFFFLYNSMGKVGAFCQRFAGIDQQHFQIKNEPCFSLGGWSSYFVLTNMTLYVSLASFIRQTSSNQFLVRAQQEKAGGERISQPLVNDGEREPINCCCPSGADSWAAAPRQLNIDSKGSWRGVDPSLRFDTVRRFPIMSICLFMSD